MASLELRWDDSHDGSPHCLGYDGGYLVGQVAFYDDVGGLGLGWVGYVIGHRVTGRCRSRELAMHLVSERAVPVLEQARAGAARRW